MEGQTIVLDVVGVILAIGTMFYIYQTTMIFKGGVVEKGLRIIALSPIFLILSILTEILSEFGFVGFDEVHDFLLVIFILLFFLGCRAAVESWKKIG